MDDENMDSILQRTTSSSGTDEGIISVDFSKDLVEDSFSDMAESCIPPDLVIDTEPETTTDNDSTKLTLAYERLYDIPKTIVEKFSQHIRYLDISHNKITNLGTLIYFRQLTSLIADHNPITETCVLPPLPKLELLWLNHCQISALFPWIGKLKESCPNIQYLSLMSNPAAPSYFNGGNFYEYLQYRLFVISQFPSLNHLDDRKVTEDQREEAQRLYKRPLLDRLVRPGAGGIAELMKASVTWSGVQNRVNAMWSKKKDERNLMI